MEKNDTLFFKFTIVCDCTKLGETVHVTGNQIHNWNTSKSVELKTTPKLYPIWESDNLSLNIAYDKPFEYKYLIKKGNIIVKWEDFNGNRIIPKLINQGDEFKNFIQVSKGKFGFSSPQTINFGDNLILQPKIEVPQTVFIKTEFIYSEEDEKLIQFFLEKDCLNKTWKKKLEFVGELVSQKNSFSNKLLALISSYLFFLNTGQIKCAEDGTHYRPNHHAGIALNICSKMLKCQTEENSYIIRSIIKELPSFSSQFMVTVPFTRIRDIAHRNDIPKDLKTEIKNTLQNKLHRSAAPEDLKTCERIYNKIKTGDYSEEFVEQFTIFYEELKEFFNALSVDKVLIKIKESNHDLSEKIEKFLLLKNSSDNQKNTKIMMSCLTELRQLILEKLEKELYQNLYIADIELENYLFPYLSLFLNKFDKSNVKVNNSDVQELLIIITYCLKNLVHSKVYSTESQIILDDINHFNIKINDTENLLILKAILERLLNVCFNFSTDVIKNYTEIVNLLGSKLNIPENSVKVFSEAFIRTHTIFQITKIVSLIFTYIRIQLNLPPYISISIGNSEGYFLNLSNLNDFHKKHNKLNKAAYILFLNESDGSEELPAEIKGVVLAHDLPQLSHLAIRARQQKAVFVCCCESKIYQEFLNKFKESQIITLNVKNNIEIKASDKKELQLNNINVNNEFDDEIILKEEDELSPNNAVEHDNNIQSFTLNIEDAEKSMNGAKAFNIKQLSLVKSSLYETPNSYTIPFSIYSKFFKLIENSLIKEIDNLKAENIERESGKFRKKFEDICFREQETLDRIYSEINSYFNSRKETLYAFRSSSNLEDLSKNAGAGLFDSILGISLNEKEKVIKSIVAIWSSLFTSRGLQFRRKNKIPSSYGKMGVLIQEMINPQLSFIIHTVNPISLNEREVYLEIALGLGETLASANQKGSPFRFSYSKDNGNISVLNYSSYSKALVRLGNSVDYKLVMFKDERVFTDKNFLLELINKLGEIALHIENKFNGPQDIEGCVQDEKIYLVQTRPQII